MSEPSEPSASSTPLSPRERIAAAAQARLGGGGGGGGGGGVSGGGGESSSAPTQAELARRQKEEEDLLLKLRRVLDLQIMRDNNYAKANECLQTLQMLISNIISNPTETKYRSFKSQNTRIQRTLLSAQGGIAYLLLAGFGTRTVDFKEEWYLSTTIRPPPFVDSRWHKLELALKVLKERKDETEYRATRETERKNQEAEIEKNRSKLALEQAREDRERVQQRAARERINRRLKEEAEAKKQAAQRERGGGTDSDDRQENPPGAMPSTSDGQGVYNISSRTGSAADSQPEGITREDYTTEVPFDAPSHRENQESQEADTDGEAPPPYGREHLGSGRRLGGP
ncbi:unnamed protein product [Sympodiomycopsis kandeliae]